MYRGANSNIEMRLETFQDAEIWELTRTERRGETGNVDLLRENQGSLTGCFVNADIILRIREGSILLTVMLINAKSLEYYKNPEQMKALGKKIAELLKSLRKENGLDYADFDGINIQISEEDIQEVEAFFKIGKYHRIILTYIIAC